MKSASKNTEASQALQTAIAYYKSGQFFLAEGICRKALLDDPKNASFLHMLGIIAGDSGRYDDAVDFFTQAIQIDKTDPQFFFCLGLALQKQGKPEEALLKYKKAVSLKPDHVGAFINMGDILKGLGRFDEAEMKYKRVIALKAEYAVVYCALGEVLQQQDKIDEAVPAYQKALALRPDMAEAYNNLGVVFNVQKKFDEAAEMYRRTISVSPDNAQACYNLGNLLRDQGKLDEALVFYAKAAAIKPDFADAFVNLGMGLQERGMINEAIVQYERLLALQPDNPPRLGELVHLLHHGCVWDKIGDREARLLDSVRRGHAGISPFIVLGTSATAEDQLLSARAYSRSKEQPQQAQFTHKPRKSVDRIKIGYLSSDLHSHATAYLMAELFERHDRARFSVTAYSYGPEDNSAIRKRIIRAFDSFVDLRDLSDRDAAQKIYDDGIDILIDLKGGYTRDVRIGIPAYRPAPVQVNYLGYPGTMGVSFIDYIIADRFIIPEDQERFYSEKVVCLPDSYQPNDTSRIISEVVPTRAACGLPEHGFVFCCFNANYKITRQVFDIWMRLLQKVPGSVLWLLEGNHSIKGNLKAEAQRRGIDPERIIFAPKLLIPEHLARHRLADLFLDTLPINAHTTVSDALWAGLPVLTCVGSTFAGRVAGSLLKAANLPELIAYSLEDYEALALQLAQNPAKLSDIRRKLERTRLQVPLFDIEKFVKNIEKSYQTMWDNWRAGEAPKAFSV